MIAWISVTKTKLLALTVFISACYNRGKSNDQANKGMIEFPNYDQTVNPFGTNHTSWPKRLAKISCGALQRINVFLKYYRPK